jgi:hypothetical protein
MNRGVPVPLERHISPISAKVARNVKLLNLINFIVENVLSKSALGVWYCLIIECTILGSICLICYHLYNKLPQNELPIIGILDCACCKEVRKLKGKLHVSLRDVLWRGVGICLRYYRVFLQLSICSVDERIGIVAEDAYDESNNAKRKKAAASRAELLLPFVGHLDWSGIYVD